jgi:hypothetical protein
LSQSVTWSAVSSCRAFRSTASRCGPGGSVSATFRSCFASSAKRSWRECVCLKRRRSCKALLLSG